MLFMVKRARNEQASTIKTMRAKAETLAGVEVIILGGVTFQDLRFIFIKIVNF